MRKISVLNTYEVTKKNDLYFFFNFEVLQDIETVEDENSNDRNSKDNHSNNNHSGDDEDTHYFFFL